jgi:hypothetical protein
MHRPQRQRLGDIGGASPQYSPDTAAGVVGNRRIENWEASRLEIVAGVGIRIAAGAGLGIVAARQDFIVASWKRNN